MDALSLAILAALGESPDGMSLPRLGKQLGLGASVLLRRVHLLSDAHIGGQAGPGLVRVESLDGRWMVYITDAGRALRPASPSEIGDASDGQTGV